MISVDTTYRLLFLLKKKWGVAGVSPRRRGFNSYLMQLDCFGSPLLFPTPLAIFSEVSYIRTTQVGDFGLAPLMKSKFTQQSLPIHKGTPLPRNGI
jgi:hypothetical protein